MQQDASKPDPDFARGIVVLVTLAAGATGVIGGLVLASDCVYYSAETHEFPSAGYTGAAVFLGGCACLIAALRTVAAPRARG